MTTQSDYRGDRLLDSLEGRLEVLVIFAIGVAGVAIWTYLLW